MTARTHVWPQGTASLDGHIGPVDGRAHRRILMLVRGQRLRNVSPQSTPCSSLLHRGKVQSRTFEVRSHLPVHPLHVPQLTPFPMRISILPIFSLSCRFRLQVTLLRDLRIQSIYKALRDYQSLTSQNQSHGFEKAFHFTDVRPYDWRA